MDRGSNRNFIVGPLYWKLTDTAIAPGYPKKISKDWDGLPSNIDAAFTFSNGATYVFKATKYWKIVKNKVENGYPKLINKGFPGIPDYIDAAFVWSGNGKIYFFKGKNLESPI